MADICEDYTNKKKNVFDIYYAINVLRKVQHIKPTKEKVYSYLKKIDKDIDFTICMFNIEMLERRKFISVQGETEQESLFINKSFSEFCNIYNNDEHQGKLRHEMQKDPKETPKEIRTEIFRT